MTAHWLSCGGTVPAATTSQWDWGTFPQWLSAVGTVAATVTALWIASRQRAAQERVLAGVQKEKAAHVALEDLDREGVTVRNHGQTPVTNTLLVGVEVYLDEDGGEDVGWLTVGRARARGEPQRQDLLPAGGSVRFTFTDWSSPEGLTLDSSLRRGNPRVTFSYTDAAGTRWRREGADLPIAWGGAPLPGAAAERRRAVRRKRWRRWGQGRRTAWKNLRLGLRGKGFTQKQRREKRRKKKGMQPGGQG
ncbi:hypothetical protein ACFQ7G_19570 [Streptomyces massasporeus]